MRTSKNYGSSYEVLSVLGCDYSSDDCNSIVENPTETKLHQTLTEDGTDSNVFKIVSRFRASKPDAQEHVN